MEETKRIREEKVSQVHPWVLYWARYIDYLLFSFIVGFALGIILYPVEDEFIYFFRYVVNFYLGLCEVFCYQLWDHSRKMAFKNNSERFSRTEADSRALNRSFSIWLKGMGAGLQIVNLITLHIAYDKLIEEGVTSWDR